MLLLMFLRSLVVVGGVVAVIVAVVVAAFVVNYGVGGVCVVVGVGNLVVVGVVVGVQSGIAVGQGRQVKGLQDGEVRSNTSIGRRLARWR